MLVIDLDTDDEIDTLIDIVLLRKLFQVIFALYNSVYLTIRLKAFPINYCHLREISLKSLLRKIVVCLLHLELENFSVTRHYQLNMN